MVGEKLSMKPTLETVAQWIKEDITDDSFIEDYMGKFVLVSYSGKKDGVIKTVDEEFCRDFRRGEGGVQTQEFLKLCNDVFEREESDKNGMLDKIKYSAKINYKHKKRYVKEKL